MDSETETLAVRFAYFAAGAIIVLWLWILSIEPKEKHPRELQEDDPAGDGH